MQTLLESKFQKNVMVTGIYKDSVFYRVACDCGNPECDMTVEVECDEHGDVWVHLTKTLKYCSSWGQWRRHSDKWYLECWETITLWFERRKKQIRDAFTILFKGYLETSEEAVFLDGKHLQNFLDALQEGINHMRKEAERSKKEAEERNNGT